jgi:hypothetical protein
MKVGWTSVGTIEARFGSQSAMVYRMRCEGAKLDESGKALGISEREA